MNVYTNKPVSKTFFLIQLPVIILFITAVVITACSDLPIELDTDDNDVDTICPQGQARVDGECTNINDITCPENEESDSKGNCVFDSNYDNQYFMLKFERTKNTHIVSQSDLIANFTSNESGAEASVSLVIKENHATPRTLVPTIEVPSGIKSVTVNGIPVANIKTGAQAPVADILAQDYNTNIEYELTTTQGETLTYSLDVKLQALLFDFYFDEQYNAQLINPDVEDEEDYFVDAVFTENAGEVTVALSSLVADPTRLIPTFSVSAGSTIQVNGIDQLSDTSPQDFSASVEYVVATEDTSQSYSISLSLAPWLESFVFNKDLNAHLQTVNNVVTDVDTSPIVPNLDISWHSDIASSSQFIPSFVLSYGSNAHVGAQEQSSGLSSHDFSSAVEYVITGQNGASITHSLKPTILPTLVHVTSTDDNDNADYALFEANEVATALSGTSTYLFATGFAEEGMSVFSMGTDGQLSYVSTKQDDASINLESPEALLTTDVGGAAHVFVASSGDDGISLFGIGTDGSLTHKSSLSKNDLGQGNTALSLNGACDMAAAQVAGTLHLFVASATESSVNVFSVSSSGVLTHKSSVVDDTSVTLNASCALTTATVGGSVYLFVASSLDNGVTVFGVEDNGALTYKALVKDTGDYEIRGAYAVSTATIGSTTYLFVAGFDDDGVSVFSVANNGSLTHVHSVSDTGDYALDGANALATTVIGGVTYLLVTGYADKGLSVFSVAANGVLTHKARIIDNNMYKLAGVNSLTTAVVDGAHYIIATGEDDNGLSVFR